MHGMPMFVGMLVMMLLVLMGVSAMVRICTSENEEESEDEREKVKNALHGECEDLVKGQPVSEGVCTEHDDEGV